MKNNYKSDYFSFNFVPLEKGMSITMKNIILKINGMKCTGCSQRVERALKNTDGIKDASVDLDSREAKISYNKDEISVEQICETITEVGFKVEE